MKDRKYSFTFNKEPAGDFVVLDDLIHKPVECECGENFFNFSCHMPDNKNVMVVCINCSMSHIFSRKSRWKNASKRPKDDFKYQRSHTGRPAK